MTMAGPHISARMAADGYLPARLAARPGAPPRAALLLQLAIAILLIWTATYDRLLTYVGFMLGLNTAATVLGLIRLRRREGPAMPVWGWPWVPVLFLLFVLATSTLAVLQRPLESAAGLALTLVGLAAYRVKNR
jgi:APA family basic amino acid/polyamine antiporter